MLYSFSFTRFVSVCFSCLMPSLFAWILVVYGSQLVEPGCNLPRNFTGTWFTTGEFDTDVVMNATHIYFKTKIDQFTFRESYFTCQQNYGSRYLMSAVTVGKWCVLCRADLNWLTLKYWWPSYYQKFNQVTTKLGILKIIGWESCRHSEVFWAKVIF